MITIVKDFIKELQGSSEARKLRWLVVSSFFMGGMVIFLWSGYFSNMLLIDTVVPTGVEGVAVETEKYDEAFSVWDEVKSRVGLVTDVVTSFLGSSAIPVPAK